MQAVYNFIVRLTNKVLPFTGSFNEKMKKFIDGRIYVIEELNSKISPGDKVVWFHMASLGEFEQGLPIIEEVKELYPACKIVISFFSPSGYEQKRNTPVADAVVYLPLDTPKNARNFLDAVHPDLAIFIKYEFWPNYLKELKERNIPTLLASGGFRSDQLFFKPYGGWMRKSLDSFDYFFVQNEKSKNLLNAIGYHNVVVSGDTRFDRVARQIEQNNHLHFIEKFLNEKTCIVAGSTWPEDEDLLRDFINSSSEEVKFILAPHKIKKEQILKLKISFQKKTVLFSEMEGKNLAEYQVFIVDTIGYLSRIYNYADVAYVGGAAGNTGLHNILEPATFGIPIVIGKDYKNFPEAHDLRKLGGLFSVSTSKELKEILSQLLNDPDVRQKTGLISGHFIQSNRGATKIVRKYLEENVKIV